MSSHVSFLKARYAVALMNTALIGSDGEAHQLIRALSTETPTPRVSEGLASVERAALVSILALARAMGGRGISSASSEWIRAKKAVDHWVSAASNEIGLER
ncbi:hypothetical protein RPMA_26665 [Tardiphaga alba]|uniref:Uncharacterized protein n=1 Tax=Tardiphaga alba TaxID=340268 RepID=A0ABX8AEQ2_9BRAD|nr:hypothetical protein [Tardiphaga alba]QUS42009.1 hypothetical protein RPMA_26665 [Tardiphaga alba]